MRSTASGDSSPYAALFQRRSQHLVHELFQPEEFAAHRGAHAVFVDARPQLGGELAEIEDAVVDAVPAALFLEKVDWQHFELGDARLRGGLGVGGACDDAFRKAQANEAGEARIGGWSGAAIGDRPTRKISAPHARAPDALSSNLYFSMGCALCGWLPMIASTPSSATRCPIATMLVAG